MELCTCELSITNFAIRNIWGRIFSEIPIVFLAPRTIYSLSLVPRPSFWWVRQEREKEGLGDNPGRKCPEGRQVLIKEIGHKVQNRTMP